MGTHRPYQVYPLAAPMPNITTTFKHNMTFQQATGCVHCNIRCVISRNGEKYRR